MRPCGGGLSPSPTSPTAAATRLRSESAAASPGRKRRRAHFGFVRGAAAAEADLVVAEGLFVRGRHGPAARAHRAPVAALQAAHVGLALLRDVDDPLVDVAR